MKPAHQLLETALVLVNGLIALFYGLWRCIEDVLATTGVRVFEIWRK